MSGGAADADGRLQAGDQLLRVDGQSLIGITQERAADYLVRTGPIVTLEVAKQGKFFQKKTLKGVFFISLIKISILCSIMP